MSDLNKDLMAGIDRLENLALLINKCSAEGRLVVPIANAYPILTMTGIVVLGWLLFRQAGIAAQKLTEIFEQKGINPSQEEARAALFGKNKDAAYLDGKLKAASYFIKHCLPQADALYTAINSNDLSMMAIDDRSF
jgi:hypothetical protein